MNQEGGTSLVPAALCQALMDLSETGVLQIDDERRIRGCNRALCRMLDYAPAELLGVGLEELRALDRRRENGPSLEHRLRLGESCEGHYSFRRKDGTELHLACTLRMTAAPGTHLLLLSPAKMIGQSFMVEGESEQRLRMLIDQAPFAVQIFALDGTLLHANHAWEQIWGVRAEDVVGRYNALHDPQIAAMGLADILAQVFAGHEAGALPAREYAPPKTGVPGRTRWVELRFFHIRDEHEQIKYVCVQNEDVTERKEAEAERQKLLAQLHQAQKMEAIGRLAGGVAHDFNNLLTGIRGFVDVLLATTEADDPRRDSLHEIARAADRAAGLTAQLLAFGRRQVIEPQVLVLDDLIADSANMLRRLIGEDIELVVTPSEHPDRVLMDPHQLDQILMNLATNGRDAMPQGGRLVLATSRATIDDE